MRLMIVDDEYFAIQGILDGVNWEILHDDGTVAVTASAFGSEIDAQLVIAMAQ